VILLTGLNLNAEKLDVFKFKPSELTPQITDKVLPDLAYWLVTDVYMHSLEGQLLSLERRYQAGTELLSWYEGKFNQVAKLENSVKILTGLAIGFGGLFVISLGAIIISIIYFSKVIEVYQVFH
jgi:hypothetical protein